ncbi:MAG: substrate-binding domain-containing protein [Candidatus Aminicenantes bacterium]|jgi:ribose transport system substrate-binding protein
MNRENSQSSRILLLTLIVSVLSVTFFACTTSETEEPTITIAVIPKGSTHIFWESVHAGAIKASVELGVDINWVGPEKEDDRQQQIAVVDNQVLNNVSGIVLAPLDEMALRRPVRDAVRRNIPVIIFDSALHDSEDIYTSFIATDNRKGGRIAGREMGKFLGGKGRVVLLRYMEGSASTTNREEGFLESLEEFPEITLVSDEQYAGATRAQAQQASENLLLRFKDEQGNLTIDGIFCPNASSTYGMLQALRRQRQAGKLIFIGFDSDDPLVKGLEQGEIHGLVVQNPFQMGFLGVKVMLDHLRGVPVEKRIDTGVTFVVKQDLEKPEIQELIDPNLEYWLSQK